MKISVILVSPKGASNVGGVARSMGNFGLSELRIVKPRCNLNGLAAMRMSMASYPIVQNAKIFKTFEEAQADMTYSIALSGRLKDREIPVGRPQDDLFSFAQKFQKDFHSKDKIALVFGREESGLRLAELNRCDKQIYIPTVEDLPSINLSSAVAITLSALHFHLPKKMAKTVPLKKTNTKLLRPPKDKEEFFFKRMYELLDLVKFLNPQNPQHLLEDLRNIYHRALCSDRDLRILFGILKCIEFNVQKPSKKILKRV